MRRLLVTGGAGFIGSNFVHYWKKKHPGDFLAVIDKLTYAGNLENLKALEGIAGYKFYKGDICDASILDRIFADDNIDLVVNFAAESHVDRSILGPLDFIETNIKGTFTLLEAAKKAWKSFEGKRFLHVSTDEVYGSLGPTGYFTEDTPYRPNSPYAASKASADHLVRAYFHTYSLPVITTNCSNNYGPYQFPEKLIPLMVLNALKGKKLPVYGDGSNVRDWLYVKDHVKAIELVIERGRLGETYNIGGGNEQKNIDIVNLVCSLVDEAVSKDVALKEAFPFDGTRKKLITYVTDRPGHDKRYAIDASKIRRELGWQETSRFEGALKETVKWYLDNRQWWERILSGDYKDYYSKQYGQRL